MFTHEAEKPRSRRRHLLRTSEPREGAGPGSRVSTMTLKHDDCVLTAYRISLARLCRNGSDEKKQQDRSVRKCDGRVSCEVTTVFVVTAGAGDAGKSDG